MLEQSIQRLRGNEIDFAANDGLMMFLLILESPHCFGLLMTSTAFTDGTRSTGAVQMYTVWSSTPTIRLNFIPLFSSFQ